MNKLAFHKGYTEGLEKVAISTLDKTSASMPPFRIIDPAKFVAKQVRTGMTYTPPGPGKPAASFKTKNLVQKLMDILSKTSAEKVAFGPAVGGEKNTLTDSIADAVYPEQDPVAIKRKRLQTMLQALKPQVAHYKAAMVPIASIGNDQEDFQNNRLAKALSGQFEIPAGNGRKMTIHTNPVTWAAAKAKTGQMYRKEGYTFKERMNHAFTGRKKQAPVTSQGPMLGSAGVHPDMLKEWQKRGWGPEGNPELAQMMK